MASSSLILQLLLLILLLNNLAAQSFTNLTRGTTFTPLNLTSWPSPSGDFAFGFVPLETDPNLFLLAVWFDKTPNKTVVWTANGGSPVTNQSKAELTRDGRLSLKDDKGQEIWNANTNTSAAQASMLDTGNLVMSSADTAVIWQSFESPTDTLLPGQVVNQGGNIFAKLTDDDYSRGRFLLRMQKDGNLVLYSVGYPTSLTNDAYWETGTPGSGKNQLVFNATTRSLYLSFTNGSTVSVFPAVSGDDYVRATLDPDGVFRQYAFPRLGNGNWTVKNSVAADICNQKFDYSGGACGFNSYCIANADGRSNCLCPPHYSFIDPAKKFMGCKPDFPAQVCEPGSEAFFNVSEMTNVDWPLADAELLGLANEEDCKGSCLKDCFCFVAIFSSKFNGGSCWKKKFPLSNGRQRVDLDRKAFIKFSTRNGSTAMPPPPGSPEANTDSSEGRAGWNTREFALSTVLGGSTALHLVMVCSFCFVYRRRRPPPPANPGRMSAGSVLCSFTYKELEEATNGFSEEVGKGAFGTVYKGALPSEPRILIAVKKLGDQSLLERAERDFANEVTAIGQTHHKNLVRLLGFCKEGVHRLLVFEFMSNGPLNKYLFGADKPEWTERVQIALGIAEGLAYLHELCGSQIIHCDIKPQNILLDHNNVAKISDFGLAKLLPLHQTKTKTFVRGTIGYFAPEWFKNVAITMKVDVYSFGVMLLEIICCKKSFESDSVSSARSESQEFVTLLDHAKECYRNRRLDLVVEEDAVEDGTRLERLLLVAISCIQDEPWLRPSMKKVVQMLEGTVPVSIPPDMCAVYQHSPVLDASPAEF